MNKDKLRYILNFIIVIYMLLIIFIIVPLLNPFLLVLNLINWVILLILTSFCMTSCEKEQEVIKYEMDNQELEILLKNNLKRKKYKFLKKEFSDIKKICYYKKHFANTLLVHEKLIVLFVDKFDEKVTKSIKKEIKKCKEYNKKHGNFRIETLQMIIFVDDYKFTYESLTMAEIIFSKPRVTIQCFNPFIIDKKNKIIYTSRNTADNSLQYEIQKRKIKRVFKGLY